MILGTLTELTKTRFPQTVAHLEHGELYVHCPRCNGRRMISVITRVGDGFRPSQGEYVDCPLCHATGEADADLALNFIEDWQEREEQ